jgi:hypothetical protein
MVTLNNTQTISSEDRTLNGIIIEHFFLCNPVIIYVIFKMTFCLFLLPPQFRQSRLSSHVYRYVMNVDDFVLYHM